VKNLVVIAVDENQTTLKIINDFLSRLGHKVLIFTDLPSFRKDGPSDTPADIVFFSPDSMEEKSDDQIRRAHELYPGADIVVMTNGQKPLCFENAMDYGVYTYLNKPFKLGELELIVARIGERRGNAFN
jgi:DNA-binding NtrC family response regulator